MSEAKCMFCGCDDSQVPLIAVQCKGESSWVCPKEMPSLIHGGGGCH